MSGPRVALDGFRSVELSQTDAGEQQRGFPSAGFLARSCSRVREPRLGDCGGCSGRVYKDSSSRSTVVRPVRTSASTVLRGVISSFI